MRKPQEHLVVRMKSPSGNCPEIESKPEWPRADYFKVRAVDERDYLLKHDLESHEWFWDSNGKNCDVPEESN